MTIAALSIKQRFLIVCSFLGMPALVLISCQNKSQLNNSTKIDSPSSVERKRSLGGDSIKESIDTVMFENFEKGKKSQYLPSDVIFKSGKWYLDNAIIGLGNPYESPDDHAIRIKNSGKLKMEFDVNVDKGLVVEITASVNKGDKHSNWGLYASSDMGASYQKIFLISDTNSFERKIFFISPNKARAVRLEIRKLSGGHNQMNFDDFTILKYRGK